MIDRIVDEESYHNLDMLIGKTISSIDCFEPNPEHLIIKFLTTNGDVISIGVSGDGLLFADIIYYLSLGK